MKRQDAYQQNFLWDLDSEIGQGNAVRFIRLFVEALDLRGMGFDHTVCAHPAQSRREPQASDETGPERGVKQQISDPFLPRMLHPEYGTPRSFVEDRWPTAPRPGSYLHRSCRLSFPLAGIGGSGRCGSQWYLFHRKYTHE